VFAYLVAGTDRVLLMRGGDPVRELTLDEAVRLLFAVALCSQIARPRSTPACGSRLAGALVRLAVRLLRELRAALPSDAACGVGKRTQGKHGTLQHDSVRRLTAREREQRAVQLRRAV